MGNEDVKITVGVDANGVDQEINKIAGKFDTLQSKIAGVGTSFENIGQSLSKTGAYATVGITAPMVAAVGAIGLLTDQAAQFEGQLSEVFTLIPGISKDAMGQMSDDVKAFSSEYGLLSSEVIPAVYQSISAGVPQENVFSFLGTAAEAAIGGCTDLETAVDGITTVMNSYTNESVSAERASDAMFTAAKLGKTNFEELSSSMYQATPLANQLSTSIEDVSTAFATLTAQGTPTAVAATQIKALLKELMDPASKLSVYLKEISGQSFKELMEDGKSFYEVMDMIEQSIQSQGKEWAEVTNSSESMQAAIGISSDMMGDFTEKMQNSAGAVDEAFNTMSESAEQMKNQIAAEVNNMAIEIGESFLPILKEDVLPILKDDLVPYIKNTVIPTIKEIADWFSNLDSGSKKIVAGLAGFSVAIGPLLLLLGPLVSGTGTLMKIASGSSVLSGLTTGVTNLGSAAATASPAIAGLFGPAGILAVGLGAGALAAYATNYANFRDNINETSAEIGEAIQNIQTGDYEAAGQNMAQAVAKGFGSVGELITTAISDIPSGLEFLNDFSDGLEKGVDQVLQGFANELGAEIGKAIRDCASDVDAAAKDLMSGFEKALLDGISIHSVTSIITDKIGTINWETVSSSLSNGMTQAFNNMVAPSAGALPEILTNFLSELVVSAIIDAFGIAREEWNRQLSQLQSDIKKIPLVGGLGSDLLEYGKVNVATSPGFTTANTVGWIDSHKASQINQDVTTNTPLPATVGFQITDDDLIKFVADQKDITEEMAQKLIDSSDKYKNSVTKQLEESLSKQAGTSVSNPIYTTSVNTTTVGETVGSTITSSNGTGAITTTEKTSGNIPTLFERDPAKYFKQSLDPIINGGFDGSLDAYEDYLSEFKMTLYDKALQVFNQDNNGGSWNIDDWVNEAVKAFKDSGSEAKTASPEITSLNSVLDSLGLTADQVSSVVGSVNDALADNIASLTESQDYLKQYNSATGQQTKYTQDQEEQTQYLLSAIGQLNNAQSLYSDAMSDTVLSSNEAIDVNAALANATKLLGDAGITAEGGLSGLPAALQSLASYAQSAISAINSAVSSASAASKSVGTVTDKSKNTYQISISNSTNKIDANYNVGQIVDGIRRIGA